MRKCLAKDNFDDKGENYMNMKKRILPLMMAVMLIVTCIPMVAGATDATGTTGDTTVTDGTTTDGTGTTTTEDPTAGTGDDISGSTMNENNDDTSDIQATDDGTTSDGDDTSDNVMNDDNDDISNSTMNENNDEPTEVTGNVVTLGENLTEEQKTTMYEYFGTSADEVTTITVTHADEVKYMEGIATAEQIGSNTVSCAYIEPTTSGGIKVKTANLNFITSQMIASALTTAGMENCNVVAACPFQVSGTGALTGIMMAYEDASGEALDEEKKEAASTELILTGMLAEQIGEEAATEVMNEAKTEIFDKGLTDPEEIGAAVDEIAAGHDVTLTDDQRSQIVDLLVTISKYDYDLGAIQNTLDGLNEQLGGLSKAWNSVKSFFVGSDDGIISDTDDEVLGSDVVTTSTVDESGFKDGLLTRIMNLFGGDEN